MSESNFSMTMPAAPAGGFAAISKYNPHLWSAEQLRAIFVARQNELGEVLRLLKNTPCDEVGQHSLLVGARGMGKSTLMQRLALAVDDDADLRAHWLALRFPEEQYTVSTLGQFWANVLDSLIDALERRGQPILALDATAQRIAALPPGERVAACLTAINRCADELRLRLLLLVDNTDLLLHTLGKSAHWALREVLQSNPRLLWVGGSYQTFESDSQYHDAFLDFFRVCELRPLRLDEMRQALLALAATFGGAAGQAALQQQLVAHPERLPTLRQLSGGNPRTTVMFYELLSSGQKGDVRSDLEALLDTMTPLYKARMEALADLPRKLLAHILEHWAPISLGQLAAASQVAKSSISPQLQRLELEGLIEKTRLHGTTRNGYQVAERFFNVWYLMRFSPRRQRARLAWLVEFMRLWFSSDELCLLAQHRMRAGSQMVRCAHDWDYDRALADALPNEAGERYGLRWSLLKELKGEQPQLHELFDFDGVDREFRGVPDYCQRLEALPEKLRQCPYVNTEEEKQAWVDMVLGSFCLTLDEKEKIAEASFTVSREQFDLWRAERQSEQKGWSKRFKIENVQALSVAIQKGEFFPEFINSELAYQQIRACFSNCPEILNFICRWFCVTYEDERCLKVLELAESAFPEDPELLVIKGRLLKRFGRWDEAELSYCRAVSLDEENSWYWFLLASFLEECGYRFEESEGAYRHAISLDSENTLAWNGLADLLKFDLARYEESEVAYRQAIALDNENSLAWNGLADLFHFNLARYDESEIAYRQAIAVNPESVLSWNGLGDLLQYHLGRYEEAETAYRQAIVLHEQYVLLCDQGTWLQNGAKRGTGAGCALRKALSLGEVPFVSKVSLARLLWRQARRDEALVLYRAVSESEDFDAQDLRLQAHLALGNRQLAIEALSSLACKAQQGDSDAFLRLEEQVRECHELSLGECLADWMAGSESAGFLLPFTQALYQLAGVVNKLQDLPKETQQMADEMVRLVRQREAQRQAARAQWEQQQ